jgi:tetratricopeptide (TPR) repeat protein
MGILSKLFGNRDSAKQSTIASLPEWSIDDGWLTIRALPQFFGKTRQSPNDRWTVAWCERNIPTTQAPQESGGSVVLLDHRTGRIHRQILNLGRPFGAAASDVGTFAVHDALAGGGLQAKVLGYSIDGEELFHRKYLANVWTLGISPCGRYVAVQTLNSPDDDGYLFEVLDLLEKRIQFSVAPSTGLADDYRFEVTSEGLQRVFVIHQALGSFAYDAKGEFLESLEFREALLTKGDFSQKIRAARDLNSEGASMDTARRTVQLADEALLEGAFNYPSWAAIAHRLKGEAYERLNDPAAAIASFERALSLDPKAGVRRALQRLRKGSLKGS